MAEENFKKKTFLDLNHNVTSNRVI